MICRYVDQLGVLDSLRMQPFADGMRLKASPEKNAGGESHISHIKIIGIPPEYPGILLSFHDFSKRLAVKILKTPQV